MHVDSNIDDLISESQRLREELIRVASKLDIFSLKLTEESMRHNEGHGG